MLNGVTILMAEDDPGHASLIRRHIRRADSNSEIIHFPDGQAVWDFLQDPHERQRITHRHLLLLDIRMPKLDGLQILERMKQDEHLKSIPVVVLTTTRDPATMHRCYELGCVNYIVKPTSIGQFARVIDELGDSLRAVSRQR